MTQPDYIPYQGVDYNSADHSYLSVLSILHYVWGGLAMLLACLAIFYIGMGVMFKSGSFPTPPPPTTNTVAAARAAAVDKQMQTVMGDMFIGCGSAGLVFGWALGILTIISGRRIAKHRSRVFSMVVAGINCIAFPLGTTLAVFTLIMLSKESAKAIYAAEGPPPA